MADKVLPTVNFDSNPGLDEFQFLHETYSQEFRYRSQISASYGIVDFSGDPATAPFTAGRPLRVSVSTVNQQTIDIEPGFAITPSNLLINIDSSIPTVPLPNITADKVYVVAVEYKLINSEQSRINRFGTLTEVRMERPSNTPPGGGASTLSQAVLVVDINDYSLYDQDTLNNLVVISVVSVRSDPLTGQLLLSVDLSRDTYAFNRPWFSVQDVEHRSKIGSGVVSDNNPHGTELQDLSSAGLTLYQQLESSGCIVSKDTGYFGYPGTLCRETITLSRIESDFTGAVTSPEGAPRIGGAYFVRLLKRPVRVGSLYFAGRPWMPVPYRWIHGTNIIVLGNLEKPVDYGEADLILEYFAVDALEVNSESLTQGTQTLTVKNPLAGQEFIVSGGLAIDTLAQTTLALTALLGPIKKQYQVLCDQIGALVVAPQPLVSFVRVADLFGAGAYQINQTPAGGKAVPVMLGLTRAIERTEVGSTILDLDVRVRISGLSEDNTALTEDIVFKAAQWRDQNDSLNVEEPLQFRVTKNKFLVVNSITLRNTNQEPPNAGPDALLSIWADVLTSTANKELASVASFFWTGVTAIKVRDERLISTTLQKVNQKQSRLPLLAPEQNLSAVQEILSVVLDPPLTRPENKALLRMVETNDDRFFCETWKEFSSTDAAGSILLTTFAAVTLGTTIRISQDKYLKIVSAGANPSIGEVNIGNSDVVFKNNLITTINDPKFDSTWFATLGGGANPAVNLSRPMAYPEGFTVNQRQSINFLSGFTGVGQSVSFKINGTMVGPISYGTSSDDTLQNIVEAIEALKDTTGVGAVISGSSPYRTIVLNGPKDGESFTVTELTSSGGAPTMSLSTPLDAFILTQPSGGVLPTPHLPERYPSAGKKWEYLSRPFLWEGAFLEGSLALDGDSPTVISNLDQVEIAPGKILLARRGSTVVDPAQGDFLVDTASLANTLANIAATINHPVWASGVQARVEGTRVIVRVAGFSAAKLQLVAQTVPGSWLLDAYRPVGPGPQAGHGFIKTLHPLDLAEWRYQLVPDLAEIAVEWSEWEPMQSVSSTAFTLHVPPAKSLYAIQFRLRGETHEPNSFSFYQYAPQISEANIATLNARLTPVESEITTARGSTGSLNARLSNIVGADGTRIQDTELTNARVSAFFGHNSAETVKERLDTTDALLQWLAGGLSNIAKPSAITQSPGAPNLLLQGPTLNKNSAHLISADSTTLQVGGTASEPLYFSIAGYHYCYKRRLSLSLTGQAAGTYYIKAELGTDNVLGLLLLQNFVSSGSASGSDTITDTSRDFVNAGVLPGHILELPSITLQGQSYCVQIKEVNSQSLKLEGYLPRLLAPNANYKVWSSRELAFTLTSSKIETRNNLYLGEVVWSGTQISDVRPYRYLNKYDSGLVFAEAAPNFEKTFAHCLGFIPRHFTLYYHAGSGGDTEPKVLHIGDEVVVKTSTNVMTVRNRYQNQVTKAYDGTVKTSGYLQLVIG